MGQRMNAPCPDRRQGLFHIKTGWGQQRLPERALTKRRGCIPTKAGHLYHLAHERIAVGMHAVRGKAKQNIALGHAFGQIAATFHRAHGKTGQIKIAIMIHAGHFCRLAADQGTARCFAPGRNTGDDARGLIHIQLAGCKVVKEEQRFRPLAHQIIDAHRHQIDADCIDASGINGDAQLGADAVSCSHQNRVGEARRLQIKQRAEATQARHRAGAVGTFCGRFDPFDQRVACININACIGIGQAVLFGCGHAAAPVTKSCAAVAHGGPNGNIRCKDGGTFLTSTQCLLVRARWGPVAQLVRAGRS